MTDLFSKETITLDDLREQLRCNDFTTMPVADKRKYSPNELEVHNLISDFMDEKWQENAKAMGQKHPSSCYSGDFPTELLRDRLEGIVSDNVIAILNNENVLNNIMESIVNPALENGVDGDECLDNTVNTLMKTVDFETMIKLSEEFTADSDFNENKAQNFPKIDHDRKWNHSRSKIKTVSYEGLNKEIANDTMRVEEQAIANADYESFLESCSDMDRQICVLLMQKYTQNEIAEMLGTTQSNVSKRISALRKRLEKDKK